MVAELDMNYVSFCDPEDHERVQEIAALWELYIKMDTQFEE